MVDVPIYRQQVRQAPATDTRLGVRANPDAMGAAVGEGVAALGRAAGTVSGVYDRMVAEADGVAVLGAKNDLDGQISPALAKAQQLRGKDAVGAADTVLPQFDTAADKIEQGLANDRQRAAFRTYRANRRTDLQQSLDAHAAAGLKDYEDQQFQVNGDLYKQRVGDNFASEGQVNSAVFDRLSEIRRYGQSNGKSEDWIKLASGDAITAAHTTVIAQQLNASDYTAAQKWLDRYGDEMDPAVRAKLSDAVQKATTDGESRRISRTIIDMHPDGPSPDLTKANEQIDAATKGMPQELADQVRQRVDQGLRLKSAVWTDTQNARAYQVMGIASDPKRPLGVDDPEAQSILRSMAPMEADKVRAAIAKMNQKAIDPIQSRLRLANYELLISSTDPALRQKVLDAGPITDDAMTVEDQRHAIDLWATGQRARNGNVAAKQELEGLTNKTEAVMGVLRAGGIDLKKTGDGSYDPVAAAHLDWIDREGKALQESRPDRKPLTADDWKVLAGKALVEQKLKGTGFWGGDTAKSSAQMQADLIAQIPAQHRAGLEETFNATHGRMPTYRELLESWAVYQQKHPEAPPDPNALNKTDIFGLPSKREGVSGFLADLWDLYQ